jgi:hypothetical protein
LFGDKLNQKDGVTVSLECGHPDVEHGSQCPLCKCFIMKNKTDLEKLLEQSIEEAKKE